MSSVIVRAVDSDDPATMQALRDMHEECFSDTHQYLFETGYWWIAFDDDVPVGFCGMRISSRWTDCGYLSRAGVMPSHRGQGIQKRLIAVRLAKAKRMNWRWVITDTRKNPASSNSLISSGFRMYSPAIPWGFKDGCYWRKKL